MTQTLDPWGALLAVVGVVTAALGVIRTESIRRHWHHHPYRMVVQRRLGNALLASGVLAMISSVARLLHWPIYGAPPLGIAAAAVVAGVFTFGFVPWRVRFAPELQRYDARFPEVAVPDVGCPPLDLAHAGEHPLWMSISVGVTAYAVFLWHPWNHVWHEGNLLLGAIAGFAIGSVWAMYRGNVGRPEQAARPRRQV